MKTTLPPVNKTIPVKGTTETKPVWVILGIFIFIMFLFGYQLMAAAAYNFFVWGDHILGAGQGNPPVLVWSLAGALTGAAAGAMSIRRKYQLPLKWSLAAVLPVILLLIILEMASAPLAVIAPKPLPVAKDSSTNNGLSNTTAAAVIKTRHKQKHVRAADTAKRAAEPKSDCAGQVAGISINARTDSVNIYYRISMQQDGAWSTWRSKFIPQQGQFILTEDGPVRANRLQYYYEIRSVLTRSAQNPYTRILCEGQLVIDTY